MGDLKDRVVGRARLAALAIAGIALCGLVGAVLVVASSPGGIPAAAASTARRGCTEQLTLAAPAGQLRACVDYRYTRDRLEVLAVAASYAASNGYDLPTSPSPSAIRPAGGSPTSSPALSSRQRTSSPTTPDWSTSARRPPTRASMPVTYFRCHSGPRTPPRARSAFRWRA
jgi:hypothetical protein